MSNRTHSWFKVEYKDSISKREYVAKMLGTSVADVVNTFVKGHSNRYTLTHIYQTTNNTLR